MSAGSAIQAQSAPVDMSKSGQWTVRLTDDDLAAVEPAIRAFLEGKRVEGRAAYVSHLVIEEIVRNLIAHTPPYARDESATVAVTVEDAAVTVVIEDQRAPFDPFGAPALDTEAPLDERRPGGMGLHLVRNLTDSLTYEDCGDRNRLTAVVSR